LTPGPKRQKSFYIVRAKNKATDFDKNCVGFPASNLIKGRSDAVHYDATKVGMLNTGHDEGILIKNGKEILTPSEKKDLIEYLKTL
jgi:hypothetical protein